MVNDSAHPEPLPPGWASGTDSEGRTFYIDHTNQVGICVAATVVLSAISSLYYLPTTHSSLCTLDQTWKIRLNIKNKKFTCKHYLPVVLNASVKGW